jgi:hypothetical protein
MFKSGDFPVENLLNVIIFCYLKVKVLWNRPRPIYWISRWLSRLFQENGEAVLYVSGAPIHCSELSYSNWFHNTYEGVSKSFRTGSLERELQTILLSATRCSCIAILWVSLVSFAAITLSVDFQRVFIVVSVYIVIDSVRELLDTLSKIH